jgi:hypothetical protein
MTMNHDKAATTMTTTTTTMDCLSQAQHVELIQQKDEQVVGTISQQADMSAALLAAKSSNTAEGGDMELEKEEDHTSI